jgi:hypothetical protein
MHKKIANIIRNKANQKKSFFWILLATFIDYVSFYLSLQSKLKSKKIIASDAQKILTVLKKEGICIIENYWSREECEGARLEIERILVDHSEFIHSYSASDLRIFGAENLSNEIACFSRDSLLINIASEYCKETSVVAFTLAAKLPHAIENRGSGEGWHRDAFFRQFKSIIYLNDVDISNGPFQFIKKSNKLWWILKDLLVGNLNYMQYRIGDDSVVRITRKNPLRLKSYPAKAGTLILVDTSAIHRGMPIELGVRYSLTNYFYPKNRINKELFEHFSPVASVTYDSK